jgi:hypothetical protein
MFIWFPALAGPEKPESKKGWASHSSNSWPICLGELLGLWCVYIYITRTQTNGEKWEKDDHPVNSDHPVNNVEDMENSDLGSRVSIISTHI